MSKIETTTGPGIGDGLGRDSKWFGKCTKCGLEKQLATIRLSGSGVYNLWLRRMCEDCRNKILFYFYTGLGYKTAAREMRKGLKNH